MVPKRLKEGRQDRLQLSSSCFPVPTRAEVTWQCDGHSPPEQRCRSDHDKEQFGMLERKMTLFRDVSPAVSKSPRLFKEWHRGDMFLSLLVGGNCEAQNGQR